MELLDTQLVSRELQKRPLLGKTPHIWLEVKLVLEKAEEPEIKLATSAGLSKKQESSRKISAAAAAVAKSLQSCPTLCDPIDGSPRGSPIPGILQARTLEWVAISFSNA